MTDLVTISFDGGSRGNPGPAAGAAYTIAKGGLSKSQFLPHATNNEAEYRGLLMAIAIAKENDFQNVLFLGDSKLVVSQVSGEWKAKNPTMSELLSQVHAQIKSIPRWRISWIARAENADADRIANEAMDANLGIDAIPDRVEEEEREGLRPDIQKLNALGAKAGFNDLRRLKVGGMDEYSRSSIDVLKVLLSDYEQLEASFHSRLNADPGTKSMELVSKGKLVVNALRWTARGLKAELAIKKIIIDHETAMKMRNKK